jgi:hypothetical protein
MEARRKVTGSARKRFYIAAAANKTAAGFLYFKLPSGVKRLENLRLEVAPSEEQTGNKLSFSLPLPSVDLSTSVADRVSNPESNKSLAATSDIIYVTTFTSSEL